MRTAHIITVAVTLLLLPAHVLAAVCFNIGGAQVFTLELQGVAGSFFTLVGDFSSACDGPRNVPITGSGHLRADQTAHIALTVPSATVNCFPFSVEGTLTPPFYNSGSGTYTNALGISGPLTFTGALCPGVIPAW